MRWWALALEARASAAARAAHRQRLQRRELVLQVDYAGLGDHLFLSHLPRIAKLSGAIDRVLLSRRTNFRNSEIRELVWNRNPYLDGETDEPGLVISGPHTDPRSDTWRQRLRVGLGVENRVRTVAPGCNLLDAFMLAYGLDDEQRMHEPEIHVDIPVDPRLADLVVYDPNFITNAGELTDADVARFFADEGVEISATMTLRNRSILPATIKAQELVAPSLLEFCSILVSCKALYCLTTGTASLAAALGKPCTVLYGRGVNPLYHHSPSHRYVRVGR